jgi:glucan phosphoethanolaminetransferase (alkaline phosphatase superfamily)
LSKTPANATTERPGTLRARLSVAPWLTVVSLAIVLAYADGFWVISLRGAAGSIQRTQGSVVSWLAESTLALPVFVLAVLGALALAARWFRPAGQTKNVVATVLLVVAAGTLVGIGALAISSGYDYHLLSGQAPVMDPMPSTGMDAMDANDAKDAKDAKAQQNHGSLVLKARAVGLGSGILLVTNLALVSWVAAIRGGRLGVSKARP